MGSSWAPRPFLVAGLLVLLVGMWAGLVRLGWALPPFHRGLPGAHGPLMAAGFLGALIALERAVALGRRWALAAPGLTAIGALVLAAGGSASLARILLTLGSATLFAVHLPLLQRTREPYAWTLTLGALLLAIGNLLWTLGWTISQVALWWAGFLVFTIAGERLELSRLLTLPTSAKASFAVCAGLTLLGLLVATAAPELGVRALGAGLVGFALWMLRYDVARRTVKAPGITRFIAVALMLGYLWLLLGGALLIWLGPLAGGPLYDATLHAIFLGFGFSMIFGHAPIILPALLSRALSFHPRFYLHLALLQISLILRIAGGLNSWGLARLWGGLLNVLAILLFLVSSVHALRSDAAAAKNS